MKCLIVIALALASLLATAPVAQAQVQDTNCDSVIPSFKTIEGNLVVPNNAKCIFYNGGTVSGNVWVGENASLNIEGNFTVGGYLQAKNCAFIALNPYGYGSTVVGRSVLISNCTGDSPALGTRFPAGAAFGSFGNGLIGGDFQCYDNTGPCILVNDHVGGNLLVMNNKTAEPSQITGNFIAKGLHCWGNLPAPTGKNNLVAGNPKNESEGQCQDF
ncbi:MAG: hypothetical protein WBV69_07730 [Candidatus Sulfotelmatobacter sp.]